MTTTCRVRGCNKPAHIAHTRLCAMHLARKKRTGKTGPAGTVMRGDTPRHSKRALAALEEIVGVNPKRAGGKRGGMRIAHKEKTTYEIQARRQGQGPWKAKATVAWQTVQGLQRRGWVRLDANAADGTRRLTVTREGYRALNGGFNK